MGPVGHVVQWDMVTEYHVVPVHRTMCKYTIIPSSPDLFESLAPLQLGMLETFKANVTLVTLKVGLVEVQA